MAYDGQDGTRAAVPVIVVLGCRTIGHDPTRTLRFRLETALVEFANARKAGITPYILCCGGQGQDELEPESVVMARWLAGRGIPDDLLLVEDASHSTEENLINARHILLDVASALATADPAGFTAQRKLPAVIVTSWPHVPRAQFLARRAGFRPVMRGARVPPRRVPRALIWEAGSWAFVVAAQLPVAQAVTRLSGWINVRLGRPAHTSVSPHSRSGTNSTTADRTKPPTRTSTSDHTQSRKEPR